MTTTTHPNPVWHGRAGFFIAAGISECSDLAEWEQLWGRRVDEAIFEICCIPFFVYDLVLGDIVPTSTFASNGHSSASSPAPVVSSSAT